jgi:TonB family protein
MLAMLTISVASAKEPSKRAVNQFNKYQTLYNKCEYKRAYKMLHKSAKSNYAKAQYTLGLGYQSGVHMESNMDKALKWWRKSANNEYAPAQYELGWCYFNSKGVKRDTLKAIEWWQRAANNGSADAQYELGCCYAEGCGVELDRDKAIEWWRKAARQGHINAEAYVQYLDNEGYNTYAASWYLEAASQGHADAQYELGCCYAEGKGVAQDYAEAVVWWHKAAEHRVAMAQSELGYCYAEGKGVEQDYTVAASWWSFAAENGIAEAQYELGCCYAEGRGGEQDCAQAAYWWSVAAEQGVAAAQYELGRIYADANMRIAAHGLLEQLPTFKGGCLAKFRVWVQQHLRYPQIALENGIQGTVVVEFVIDKSGDVRHVTVVKSPDATLSEAAIAVVQKSPKWRPGKQKGKPVACKYTLPIAFKIQN